MPKDTARTTHPFLTAFAVPRTGGDDMIGHYCRVTDVWVINGIEGARPIVEARTDRGQTSTITRVRAEVDDTDIDRTAGLGTTTEVKSEADDLDRIAIGLLSVTTKTNAQIERDDNIAEIEANSPLSSDAPIGSVRIH